MTEYRISMIDFCNLTDYEEFVPIQEGTFGSYKHVKYRIDSPNGYEGQQRHVHVGPYAWHQDGTRSHASQWSTTEPTRKQKMAAAHALKIDISALESYMGYDVIISVDEDKDLQIFLESCAE